MSAVDVTGLKIQKSNISSNIPIYKTVVKVLGAGGGGNNTISRLSKLHIKSVETIAVNTDGQDLLNSKADHHVLIGEKLTSALGAGGDPEIGERSAEESRDDLKKVLKGTDLLFLTGGLGGGTGTGSLPVIAKMARDQGTLTVAIITMPFQEEGIIRWENAQIGHDKLMKYADCVITLKNDTLAEIYTDLPMLEAFKKGDEILVNALSGISSLVLSRGLMNLDFADVSMILRDGPRAVIGLGESDSEFRAEEAAKRATVHPMMNVDITGSQSALIHVMGGTNLTLKEARQVVRTVSKTMDSSARIIWGVTIDKNLKNTVRVMLMITGLQEISEKIDEQEIEQFQIDDTIQTQVKEPPHQLTKDANKSIFDIKDSILTTGAEVQLKPKLPKTVTKTTALFYKIFEEEAQNDLDRFERSIEILRKNPENKRAILDARQACRLLQASAQMFGFDEIGQLLMSIEEILASALSRELAVNLKLLDSINLGMDMVLDLIRNRSDGRGETGFIVDRIRELKNELMQS